VGAGIVWSLGSALSAAAPRAIGPPPAGLDAERCEFSSESGSTTQHWIVRGRTSGGVVVLAHSVRSSRIGMVERARFLNAAGYAVLLFEYERRVLDFLAHALRSSS
jgi:hypothetical protein